MRNKINNLVYAVLLAVLLSSCSSNAVYTTEECRNFKKGDTIFVRGFQLIKQKIVVKNYVDKEIVKVRDVDVESYIDLLDYKSLKYD